ncbi:MAG: hypothetical protein J2P45_05855 [Candidatus Dormibacteraeota bacterium]|nr:hypothetical protein [Candidatus Dormibacteraeota bacterium]
MVRRLERWAWRYWGYVLLLFLIGVWLGRWSLVPIGLALVSLAAAIYFLFAVPGLPCGAENRQAGTFCRNNSHGLLLGCHIYHHTWQRLRGVFLAYAFRFGWGYRQKVRRGIREGVVTLAALSATGQFLVSLVGALKG